MARYPNGRYMSANPGRHFGVAPGLDNYYRDKADRLNQYYGEAWDKVTGATPSGYGTTGTVPPLKSGGIAARIDTLAIVTGAAIGIMGRPGTASASLLIDASGTGQLIVSGSGTTLVSVTASGTIVASLNGVASATLSVTTNSPAIEAKGWITASSSLSVTGSLTPYAVGNMIGSALPYTELSPQSLASAVWESVAADHNDAGTMGEKLNGAGSAGNPWTEVIESGLTAAEVMRIILSVQAGQSEIIDNGNGTATVKFKSQSGAVDRVTADMVGSERANVTVNGG